MAGTPGGRFGNEVPDCTFEPHTKRVASPPPPNRIVLKSPASNLAWASLASIGFNGEPLETINA
jgi:hypothetical protein